MKIDLSDVKEGDELFHSRLGYVECSMIIRSARYMRVNAHSKHEEELYRLGLTFDNHGEFVSYLRDNKSNTVVATIYGDLSSIVWTNEDH